MNTTENNKLIAEFLGWNINSPSTFPTYLHQEEETQGYWEFKFNTDWNWLMEVVDKIYKMDLYYDKYIDYNSSMFSSGKIELEPRIGRVYEQVVNFIKWYNNGRV